MLTAGVKVREEADGPTTGGLQTWHRIPRRRYFDDQGPRRSRGCCDFWGRCACRDVRPRAAFVVVGPTTTLFCRRWANHDIPVATGRVSGLGVRCLSGQVAMITKAGTLRGTRYDLIVGLMAQLDQARGASVTTIKHEPHVAPAA